MVKLDPPTERKYKKGVGKRVNTDTGNAYGEDREDVA
jgi:hypothetical protein